MLSAFNFTLCHNCCLEELANLPLYIDAAIILCTFHGGNIVRLYMTIAITATIL